MMPSLKDCLSIKGRAKVVASYPRIAGIELVADVVESSAAEFSPGQPVIVHGFQTGIALDGGFAEYAGVPAAHVMPLSQGLSPWQAAMIGVPGFTAAMAPDRFQRLGITPDSGTIAVFILRGVDMFGIVANASWPVRKRLWTRLASDWRPELSLLESHIHAIGIRDLINYAERHLGGKASGRTQ